MPLRRSTFLIDKAFQLRFSLYVCSWTFGLSLIYPLVIYHLFDFILRSAIKDPMGPAVQKVLEARHEVLFLLVMLQLLFLAVTFLISIILSHRIAGPIYKLSQSMKSAAKGEFKGPLTFRKSDHFQSLAEDFNQLLKSKKG